MAITRWISPVGMLQQRGWLHKRIGLDKRGWFLPVAVYEALQARLGTIADTAGVIERCAP